MPANLRITTHKILNNFTWPITVVKKCPTDMMKNITSSLIENINYLAIGTSAGHILFYNVLTGAVCKEFSVHNNLVRYIGCSFLDKNHLRFAKLNFIKGELNGVIYLTCYLGHKLMSADIKSKTNYTSLILPTVNTVLYELISGLKVPSSQFVFHL